MGARQRRWTAYVNGGPVDFLSEEVAASLATTREDPVAHSGEDAAACVRTGNVGASSEGCHRTRHEERRLEVGG